MVVPGLVSDDELQRIRLVVAREERAIALARPLRQPELQRPPRGRLVEVGDPKADVVDAAETDQGPALPRRRAPEPPALRDHPLGLVLGDRERDVEGLS